jgi:hypothetical protein
MTVVRARPFEPVRTPQVRQESRSVAAITVSREAHGPGRM